MTNSQSCISGSISIALFAILNLFAPYNVSGQASNQNPKKDPIRLMIAPIVNNTELAYIDALSDTAEENILFTGNMISQLLIIDKSKEKITSATNLNQLKRIAKTARCNYLMSGMISREGEAYSLTLILYNTQTELIEITKNAPFPLLTEVFDISDRLSLVIFGEMVGEEIKKGEVLFINETPNKQYLVTINGRKVEENIPSIFLIEGRYTICIYNISVTPKKKVLTKKMRIRQGTPREITFNLTKKKVNRRKKNKFSLPNNKNYEKENTIRIGVGIGLLLGEDVISSSEGTLLTGWIGDLPAIYYTHLLTGKYRNHRGNIYFPVTKS